MGSCDTRNKRYGVKRKFRGNQHTSSQSSNKKSRVENNPANVCLMFLSFFFFFSMEMNIYTLNIKTTATWHHDFYGCQGYKKK